MAGDEDWKNPKYRNWVRGAKGLEYLQNGLQNVVDDTVLRQRDQILQRLSAGLPVQQCNQCTRKNLLPEHVVSNKLCNKNTCKQPNNCFGNKPKGRRKCPNGICSKFHDEIVNAHRFKEPMWNNTDPSTWCSDPAGWSFAKCFQTTPNPGTSSSETDAAGLLSVILSGVFFQNEVACNLASKPNIFSAAREIRNEILHSPKLELDDAKLQGYIDTFIAVLQDPKCLLNDQEAIQAVQNLSQLKNNQITIALSEQIHLIQVRKAALTALEQLHEKGEEIVTEMEETKKEALTEIEGATSAALEKLNENDIQNRLRLTEAAIEHLTDAFQNLKTGLSDKPVENVIYSREREQDSRNTSSPSEAEDVECDDSDQEPKNVIDKAWTTLIDYMKPDPILDCAIEYDLLGYRQQRDIKEETKTTSQKNKSILETVRQKGNTGLTNLKECLKSTGQIKVVQLLDCIERGEDPSSLLKKIHEETVHGINPASKGLQDDLIEFYRSQHSTILLSPLIEEDDTPLLEFYVMPDIHAVKRDRPGAKEEKTPISTLSNVFCKDDKLCKEIYLTADAGLGKTSLSKRLTLAWCHAKSPNTNEKACFSEKFKEIDAMGEFAFVFLLSLRDSHKECQIEKMIWNQIVSRLENNYTLEDLQNIMSKERSLVILDGLDEWTHPSNNCDHGQSSIPHRRIRKNCTILTTTRPWKLSVSDIKSSQIDQKCEISGLSPPAANTLKKSVISHMKNVKDEDELKVHVYNFTRTVRGKHLSALGTNPLLLMYLICLWCDNIELGQSQSELYSKIVELLLSRTVKKYKKDADSLPKVESTQCNIPPCFSKQTHCKKFYTILTALGHLAFQTLFMETKEENTLVFDSSLVEQYLNKDCLTFCLSTGIITQSKVQIKLAEIQEPKVSFAHKTVQEFFAALYMYSTPDHTSVSEIVASKCKCVKDVLDMSTILKFIIGMNVNVASSISRELMKIINEDEITREYRNTLIKDITGYGSVSHPLKDFQDMCISCCKELPRENEVSLCLQDVFIQLSCEQEQYREHLKQLTTRNTQNIRSLYIDTPYNSVQKVVEYFALNGLENIEKIHCQGERIDDDDILPLLYRSVKCLSLSCGGPHRGSWSRLLREKVTSLPKLEAIKISEFAMSHSEWTLLCDYISHRRCMRQIVLRELLCTDHKWRSCTAILDLSQHSQLSKLTLHDIPVRTVNVNMAALEKCCLRELYNRDLVLRFMHCDPADSKLNTFECDNLYSCAAIDTVLDTLPGLHQVKHVKLSWIELDDRKLKLSSEMKNLELVELSDVTMTASSLRGVVNCVDQLPQTVEVNIIGCTITPKRELVAVLDKIKTSPRFRVSEDSEDWWYIMLKFAGNTSFNIYTERS